MVIIINHYAIKHGIEKFRMNNRVMSERSIRAPNLSFASSSSVNQLFHQNPKLEGK